MDHFPSGRLVYFLSGARTRMLMMDAKNEAATIPGPVLKRIKEEIDGLE